MSGLVEDLVMDAEQDYGLVKKSKVQIEFLEKLFSEDKNPNQKVIEDCASTLQLTFNQVRSWFTKRRKKEKRENDKTLKSIERMTCQSHLKTKKDIMRGRLVNGRQNLLPKDYILKRIFRKDGPPLGVEFDSLPEKRLDYPFCNGLPSCRSSKRIFERRQAFESIPCNKHSSSKKHGIGKGLLTAWRAAKADNKDKTSEDIDRNSVSKGSSVFEKSSCAKIMKKKKMVGKVQRRKMVSSKQEKSVECNLAVQSSKNLEKANILESLIDDEELELMELQTSSNAPRCSAHIASKGRSGCPLCKDMLARFPPSSVKMMQPLSGNPWNSSPEIVKRFFKVLTFLYTHAAVIDVCSFTLDELAQAFHDKDSMLLGRIHIGLLKLLLTDVRKELTDGFFPRGSKDCRFLGFLHSVRQQELDVDVWIQSLNPLTWVEILRQVMISAGFASRRQSARKIRDKEGSTMEKYGLKPRTLKSKLFTVLSKKGRNGAKVSDLARASQIVGLDLCNSPAEFEAQVSRTLSSDCTLFEKIGCSSYRLRKDPSTTAEIEDSESETECSGSLDYDDSAYSSSSSDSEDKSSGSENLSLAVPSKIKEKRYGKISAQSMEIDESFPGARWLLGLMESEYSDLSIEEKLDALAALVDLTGSCSSLRVEEQQATIPKAWCQGSGGKIRKAPCVKKPTSTQRRSKSNGQSSVHGSHLLQAIFLGWDRRYNGYWLFLGLCCSDDPGHRRVYFESSEDGHWEVIDSPQALATLISTLDSRGARESGLLKALTQREACIRQSMEAFISENTKPEGNSQWDRSSPPDSSSSPISDVDNNLLCEDADSSPSGAITLERGGRANEWARARAFDGWLWNHFYSSLNAVRLGQGQKDLFDPLSRCESCHDLFWQEEKHCSICHMTFELDFDLEERFLIHTSMCRLEMNCFPPHRVLPSQLQALKAAVHVIEGRISEEALVDTWRRISCKLWVKRLRRVSSMPELFQVVADFVGAIREDWLQHGSTGLDDDLIVVFQTMPQTSSSFALWLVKLDSLIARQLWQLPSTISRASVKRKRGRS